MHLFVLLPLLLLILLQWMLPELMLTFSAAFPLLIYAMLCLTGLLASLMRQWNWLYTLSLLTSHYWVVQSALQQPLSNADTAAVAVVLPLAFTAVMLLLQLQNKPQLPTARGVMLLLLTLLAPVAILLLPLAGFLANSGLPAAFLQPVSTSLLFSWGQLWWIAVVAACWLGLLNFYSAGSQRWGQFAAWLAIMLFYLTIQQPHMSGWMTLAACFALLFSLASQMLQLAYIDELTQLPQRRALLSHLSRLGRRSAVVMLDVDHFKKFNDTWGHDVGDQVLKLLGAVLGSERGVKAYRYGGEEFTLVFSHNNKDTLADKLEQVRAAVADYPLVIRQQTRPKDSREGKQQRGKDAGSKTVHITISLGCAIRQSGESTTALLKRADEALYSAKKAGRNQVAFAR
ncbi:diguanylate cyclase [Rheinheimera sp. NSM]|uniref:diguanylate cyclase n=1 Tax=Rheinheimera sp. NSM TaxID=3457884 RepID=UPI0040373614